MTIDEVESGAAAGVDAAQVNAAVADDWSWRWTYTCYQIGYAVTRLLGQLAPDGDVVRYDPPPRRVYSPRTVGHDDEAYTWRATDADPSSGEVEWTEAQAHEAIGRRPGFAGSAWPLDPADARAVVEEVLTRARRGARSGVEGVEGVEDEGR